MDFGLQTVPDRWFDAAAESGQMDFTPLSRPRPSHPIPSGARADGFAAVLAGMSMCMVAGVCWFLLELEGTMSSPWLVVGLGALVGAAVRLGAGPHDPAMRGMVALILYLVTTVVVSFLIVRYDLRNLDSTLTLAAEERLFLRRRVYEPSYALATAAGAILAVRTNYLWSRRR